MREGAAYMPHYSYEKTFTPGTTRETEEELEMPCHWGILCDVIISFRTGTDRKTHVHIDESIHQIFPTNPNGDYAFDGYTSFINDEYELLQGTRTIYLRGWNTGTYPHTVAVSFRIKPPPALTTLETTVNRMLKLWERLTGAHG
jgi:hypothetical protein